MTLALKLAHLNNVKAVVAAAASRDKMMFCRYVLTLRFGQKYMAVMTIFSLQEYYGSPKQWGRTNYGYPPPEPIQLQKNLRKSESDFIPSVKKEETRLSRELSLSRL